MESEEDQTQIDIERMRDLLCNYGESPLSDDEWTALISMADPQKSGTVSAETLKELPCWASNLPPAVASPRRKQSSGAAAGESGDSPAP